MPELVIELDAVELRHAAGRHAGPIWMCTDLICQAWTQVQE